MLSTEGSKWIKKELGQHSMNEGELRLTKSEIHWQKNSKTKIQKYEEKIIERTQMASRQVPIN